MAQSGDRFGRIHRFYAWWIYELSSVLTRKQAKERPWRTMLYQCANGLRIISNSDGRIKEIAMLAHDAGGDAIADARRSVIGKRDTNQILLRLAPSQVVRRTLRVPRAAADLLNSVVENKVETIVAWPVENTYFGYRVVADDPASSDQIDTEIIATTKTLVDSALQRAQELGLSPRAVDFAEAPEDASQVEILKLEQDPVTRTAARVKVALAGLVVCSLLAGGFGLYRLWDLQTQFDELDGKIAAVMSKVDDIKKLNDENTKIKDQRERLAKMKLDNRPAMELIEALSRALPDTAYLDEFEIHDGEARMVGKSADPTGLIGELESTPEFEDVRFAAPTTREDGQKLGTFSIVGKIQAEGTPEKRQ